MPPVPPSALNRRPIRRRVIAVVAVLTLIAGGAYLRLRDGGGLHAYDEGPVTGSSTRNVFPVPLDQPFTFGQPMVFNETNQTATLEALRIRPALPDGIEVLGVSAVGPNRKIAAVGSSLTWPDPEMTGHLHPLRGTKVPPQATPAGKGGVEIVFGLKVTKPGHYGFVEIDLDYRIGDTKHTVRLQNGYVVCAPKADYPDGCDSRLIFNELDRQLGNEVRDWG